MEFVDFDALARNNKGVIMLFHYSLQINATHENYILFMVATNHIMSPSISLNITTMPQFQTKSFIYITK